MNLTGWVVVMVLAVLGAWALTWEAPPDAHAPVAWFDTDGRRHAEGMGGGVYLARKRGTSEVKVGWTARVAGQRIGEWETGTSAPVDLEAFIPTTDKRVERAVQKALRAEGWHTHDEWFTVPEGPGWRRVVEAAAGA